MDVVTRAARMIGRGSLHVGVALLSLLRIDERIRVYRTCLRRMGDVIPQEERRKIYRDEMIELVEAEERFLVPSFEVGRGTEHDRFLAYQQQYVPFEICEAKRVLDIGSGAYPFPFATHLADLHLNGTSHRSEPLRKTGLPLQVCDIERLPYTNNAFDFVYCSHVLEHVNNPSKACEEIMRVGRRGYIETPTRLSDVMFNYIRLTGHHLWHVNCIGGTVVFMEWEDRERRDTQINDFFWMAKSKYKNAFQELFHGHRDLFVNMTLWEERFPYYVFNKEGRLLDTNSKVVA